MGNVKKRKGPSDGPVREKELSRGVGELETRFSEVRKEVAELTTKLEDSEYRVMELSEQLERIRTEPAPAEPARGPVNRTVRDSPETLESDLFTECRYTIWLSRDGHSMRITPDVEGRVLCTDRMIRLPRLRLPLPYDERSKYDTYPDDGPGIMLFLRRCVVRIIHRYIQQNQPPLSGIPSRAVQTAY